jgi:hypothetical protein
VEVECDVELSPIAASPDDATVDDLVTHYQAIMGEHDDDWHAFHRSEVAEQRVMVRLKRNVVIGSKGGGAPSVGPVETASTTDVGPEGSRLRPEGGGAG